MSIRIINKSGNFVSTVQADNQFSEGPNQLMANLIDKLVELNVLDSEAVEEIFYWEVETEDIS